jgi:hypothetical protein
VSATATVAAPVPVAALTPLPTMRSKLKKAFRNSFYKTFENSRCSPLLLIDFEIFFLIEKERGWFEKFLVCPHSDISIVTFRLNNRQQLFLC